MSVNMDYAKEIAELREKINWNKDESEIAKSELHHREILNELALKRDQVVHLKKELQTANSKIFELNREFESNKSILKETEFNLKLALKKSGSLEEKLKEINESFTNLKLKEEMRLSEIQILNENIQKIAQDNHHLSREVVELKDTQRYSRAFQDELEERQTKINTIITKIKENSVTLEKEQAKIVELDKKIQTVEELQYLNQQLVRENAKLKKENTEMENSFIETSSKYEKLHGLIKRQKNVDAHQQNLISKIKFLQWECHYKKLQEKNLNNEKIINTLTTTLDEEIETNAHLLLQNEEYEFRIQELEKKLKDVPLVKEEIDVIELE